MKLLQLEQELQRAHQQVREVVDFHFQLTSMDNLIFFLLFLWLSISMQGIFIATPGDQVHLPVGNGNKNQKQHMFSCLFILRMKMMLMLLICIHI